MSNAYSLFGMRIHLHTIHQEFILQFDWCYPVAQVYMEGEQIDPCALYWRLAKLFLSLTLFMPNILIIQVRGAHAFWEEFLSRLSQGAAMVEGGALSHTRNQLEAAVCAKRSIEAIELIPEVCIRHIVLHVYACCPEII